MYELVLHNTIYENDYLSSHANNSDASSKTILLSLLTGSKGEQVKFYKKSMKKLQQVLNLLMLRIIIMTEMMQCQALKQMEKYSQRLK